MRMMWTSLLLFLFRTSLCIEHDFKGFDDSILFGINWPGSEDNIQTLVDGKITTDKQPYNEIIKVTTADKEKYECHIPEIQVKENISVDDYEGPSPIQLIKPLFSQKICSYRLESYWSYEVCHGRYIRQYHEEREGKQVKTQEYFLGHWSPQKQAILETKANQQNKANPKTSKVEGSALPYVEMVMDDGTVCDLNGKPRSTSIKYVCYVHGKHEVYSFKEISTCEYEIIILSPLLCEHPLFKPKDVSENMIDCVAIGGAPKKPNSLTKLEFNSLQFNHQTIRLMNNEKNTKDVLAVLKVEKIDKDGETHLKLELHPLSEEDDLTETSTKVTTIVEIENKPSVVIDDTPVRAFLKGENCLTGGTGWWKYEFCYGKHVVQYHVDRSGQRTTLLLGKFHKESHIDWIKENKAKAPKPKDQRTSISHFYSEGDVCDKTGKPRQTEVKLKCLENSSSSAQVSLYLLEPKTCHYILGVESPLICEILPLADENGLVQQIKPLLSKDDHVSNTEDEDIDVNEYKLAEVLGND